VLGQGRTLYQPDGPSTCLRIERNRFAVGADAEVRCLRGFVGSIAEFEREIMLERQREGVAAAKAEDKYKGRTPTARAKATEMRSLSAEGLGKAEIARRLGVAERSVYRMLAGLS